MAIEHKIDIIEALSPVRQALDIGEDAHQFLCDLLHYFDVDEPGEILGYDGWYEYIEDRDHLHKKLGAMDRLF